MSHRGASRPMRASGLLLLGVAAVAAVIGTASAVSGNGDPGARPPAEESTPASEPGGVGDPGGETSEAPSEEPTESEEPTSESSEKPTKSSTPAPTSTGQAPGGSDGSGDSVKSVSVRVYNNSNVKGLANRAAEDLRARGWNVVAAGNYSEGIVYTTTAYYRPGTTEQAAAEEIGAEFGMRVAPRFEGIEDSSPGVIVIVTKDYQSGKS